MKKNIMKKDIMNKEWKKKLMLSMLTAASAGLLFGGCGKKEEEAPPLAEPQTVIEEEEAPEQTVAEETLPDEETVAEDIHAGEARSYLTGEWIDKKLAKQRPVSCMIGNTDSALPQYGIGQAQVIFEAPVEGGLTRLMGIFENYKELEKLGSVRSSRLYYAYYSMGFDAIYLHYGQASYAQGFLESGQIDDLNGLEYEVDKAVIYRDTAKKAPHNAYATGKGLEAGIGLKQYETKYQKGFKGHFQFAPEEEPVVLNGKNCQDAVIVQPGYLINKPYFEYNPEDGLYYRYQYGARQIDGNDSSQLAVKNILIQNSSVRTLDDKGYLEIEVTGEGTGWYITGGKATQLTWKREEQFAPTTYFDSEGKEILLNPGKTWVCITDNSHLDRVHIYADAEQMQ
ncbi:MAG: DUF3048 domain-containing protein [Eubacterium sp.]|nr:DUF3048 domain-containing protein [Eubacterium sp.]